MKDTIFKAIIAFDENGDDILLWKCDNCAKKDIFLDTHLSLEESNVNYFIQEPMKQIYPAMTVGLFYLKPWSENDPHMGDYDTGIDAILQETLWSFPCDL